MHVGMHVMHACNGYVRACVHACVCACVVLCCVWLYGVHACVHVRMLCMYACDACMYVYTYVCELVWCYLFILGSMYVRDLCDVIRVCVCACVYVVDCKMMRYVHVYVHALQVCAHACTY